MNEFEAYCLYVSLKSHFNNKNYDFFKYSGKIKSATPESFKKRKDGIFFMKLAKHSNPRDFLVANMIASENNWIGNLAYSEEAEKNYREWSKRKQSFSYLFEQDLKKLNPDFNSNFKVEENTHPQILKLYLGKQISIETFVVLLEITGVKPVLDRKMKDDPIWEKVSMKVQKYSPFVSYDKEKARKIILDIFR